MNRKDIKNSIFLIGPACVGKSLLATELGKKLDIPVVCIDDLLIFVQYENLNILGVSKQQRASFISQCNRELKDDKNLKQNLNDSKYRKAQLNRASEIYDLYKYYVDLFGGLKPFKNMVKTYNKVKSFDENDIERIVIYSSLATLMIKKTIEIINKPVIFDTPAMFGWKFDENKLSEQFKNRLENCKLKIKLSQISHYQSKILKYSNSVFLEPGKDYNVRNASKNSSQNKLLLKHIENYMENANILVTTNDMFNQPENKYFQNRTWFDVKELETKEKLKDKCNITNICDEIISLVQEDPLSPLNN